MAIFSFTPDYTWQISLGHEVYISKFESGKEQRQYKRRKPREWELSFSGSRAFINEIISFWNERKGPFESFLWTVPNSEETVTVRFKDEDLNNACRGLNLGSLKVSLKEVI